MILSNEPGYYKENKFGIRIENLVYVKKLLEKNINIRKKKNNKPKAVTKGVSRDILRKNNKKLNREIKSRFKL